MQCVEEYGVVFHRIPENAAEQKKVASVFNYWVIRHFSKSGINLETLNYNY